MFNKITKNKNVDESNAVTAIFMDLSKAFDMVRHALLLWKLNACRVKGLTLERLKS